MTWLLLNLIVTWYMVGLIWLIQIVHYPLLPTSPLQPFLIMNVRILIEQLGS